MNNKINEIIVAHNEELSSELILQYLQERKLIQIKNNSCISNRLSPIKSGNPGVIINSSGSINMPKHCYHSIANLNQSAKYCGKWLEEQDFDLSNIIIFNTLPLSHISGFMPLWRSKIWDCEYINISPKIIKESKYLLEQTLKIKGKSRKILITSLVPTQLYRLLLNKDGINWLNLFDLIWVGGASVSKNILKKCIKEKINLSPCYGATETAAMISSLKPREFLNSNLNDGEIFKDINVRINEKNLIEIKTERIGKEVSQSSEIKDFKNKDGWWESGDIGKKFIKNNKEYLIVYGRVDNTINSGGEIVFLDLIKKRILDFINNEDLPVKNFKFEKINDLIWGQRYRILIDFKENTANKNLFKSIKKLENFSETFQKFERPFEWIVNEEEIDSDNYIKDWKNNA
mgnify:FL=1